MSFTFTDAASFLREAPDRDRTDLYLRSIRWNRAVAAAVARFASLEELIIEDAVIAGGHLTRLRSLSSLRILRLPGCEVLMPRPALREDGTYRNAFDAITDVAGLCVLDLSRLKYTFGISGKGHSWRDWGFLRRLGAVTELRLDGAEFPEGAERFLLEMSRLRTVVLSPDALGAETKKALLAKGVEVTLSK